MQHPCFLVAVVFFLCCVGCGNLAVRSKSSRYTGEVEFTTDLRDGEFETHQSWDRIEFAWELESMELFVDGGSCTIEDDDDARLDADGYGFGFGGRSLPPSGSGWGPDIGLRFGYHDLDFGRNASSVAPDWNYEGFDSEINIGAYRAFSLAGDIVFSLHGGAYLKELSERLDKTGWILLAAARVFSGEEDQFEGEGRYGDDYYGDGGHGRGDEDSEYSLFSVGLYFGTRLNFASTDWIDVSADVFAGTDRMAGFALAGAIRF